MLLLDDGLIRLDVRDGAKAPRIVTRVELGGVLSNNKGINRQGGGLTAPALTAKDMDDMKTAAKIKADYLAVSFPKSKADMYMARELLRAAGGQAFLIAKIERAEAITALEEIIEASRRHHGRARRPGGRSGQRHGAGAAEADDPARARAQQAHHHRDADDGVDDLEPGADARRGLRRRQRGARRHRRGHALGRDRRRAVSRSRPIEAMSQICVEAEKSDTVELERDFLNRVFTRVDQSIAMAALFTAYHLKVKAIAVADRVGLDRAVDVAAQLRLPDLRADPADRVAAQDGALPQRLPADTSSRAHDREELLRAAEDLLVARGVVKKGDLIVLTIGEPMGKSGGTNTMKIVKVGEHRS